MEKNSCIIRLSLPSILSDFTLQPADPAAIPVGYAQSSYTNAPVNVI